MIAFLIEVVKLTVKVPVREFAEELKRRGR